ncbi:MAG: zf-HC2 domain-containing protein, partial [Candidatus Aminicenantales bacterium]
MNCKAIERLILEGEERHLEEGERRRVEEHLRDCPGCRAFEAGRRVVREELKEIGLEGLPRTLDLRTRNLCLEALGA